MAQAIKTFCINAFLHGRDGTAEDQANKWLAENPKVKVISYTATPEYRQRGIDDLYSKVEMVIEFEGS